LAYGNNLEKEEMKKKEEKKREKMKEQAGHSPGFSWKELG
jgi:hypothetical protein